jgi:hypothetical protein
MVWNPETKLLSFVRYKILFFLNILCTVHVRMKIMLCYFQGCNKKKVADIIKLRPFEGWVDLVTKLQTSRNLRYGTVRYLQF